MQAQVRLRRSVCDYRTVRSMTDEHRIIIQRLYHSHKRNISNQLLSQHEVVHHCALSDRRYFERDLMQTGEKGKFAERKQISAPITHAPCTNSLYLRLSRSLSESNLFYCSITTKGSIGHNFQNAYFTLDQLSIQISIC